MQHVHSLPDSIAAVTVLYGPTAGVAAAMAIYFNTMRGMSPQIKKQQYHQKWRMEDLTSLDDNSRSDIQRQKNKPAKSSSSCVSKISAVRTGLPSCTELVGTEIKRGRCEQFCSYEILCSIHTDTDGKIQENSKKKKTCTRGKCT